MTKRALAGIVSLLLGCSELPEIPEGECGNLVVEAREDCDGFDGPGVCRTPGSPGECHWDCAEDAPEPLLCPTGFGCDADGVCRRPRGEFAAVNQSIPGNAQSLLAGDFDGDGRDDVVGIEPPLAYGITKPRIHYFDERAQLARTWVSGKFMVSPTVRELTGDGRADLAFAFEDLQVLSGSTDRSLIPHSYPSYILQDAARMLPVSTKPVEESLALLVFARGPEGVGLHHPNSRTGELVKIVDFGRGVEDLAGKPAIGKLFDADDAECSEVVFAFRGERHISVVSSCERDPATGRLRWKAEADVVEIELGAAITSGVLLADLDVDGHLDVMAGTDQGPLVSFGDGVTLSPPAAALALDLTTPELLGDPRLMPLAAGDLNSDGFADLVFPSGIVFSSVDPLTGEVSVRAGHAKYGKPWTEAVIADLNGNGFLDVAAISRESVDVDVFNGSGKGVNRFVVPTERPAEHLSVTDLDGDFINDLVFVEREQGGEPDFLSIAFGNPVGAPEAPVTAARLDGIVQIAPIRAEVNTSISDLLVAYRQAEPDGGSSTALSIFIGSSDRLLSAPIELSAFAETGLLISAVAYTTTVGHLTSLSSLDVVAVAELEPMLPAIRPSLWMLPDLASGRSSPRELGWPFADDLEVVVEDDSLLAMQLAAGDLDADGLDELVAVAPNAAGRCVVSAARFDPGGTRFELLGSITLDEACRSGSSLRLLDLDGASGLELLLLTGDFESARRLVAIAWNGGGFGAEVIAPDPGEPPPQAFAAYRATSEGALELAYVTDSALYLRPLLPGPRPLGEPKKVGDLSRGTGVVAADVNGDGVRDLVVADNGRVRVFRALLEP